MYRLSFRQYCNLNKTKNKQEIYNDVEHLLWDDIFDVWINPNCDKFENRWSCLSLIDPTGTLLAAFPLVSRLNIQDAFASSDFNLISNEIKTSFLVKKTEKKKNSLKQ